MNDLKSILSEYISKNQLIKFIGKTVYEGINNYIREYKDTVELQPVDILIDYFGSDIFSNIIIWQFIIDEVLTDAQITSLAKILNIKSDNNFEIRSKISNKNNLKNIKATIELLGINPDLYLPASSNKPDKEIVEHNVIIPEKFLPLHNFQKTTKDDIVRELFNNSEARMLVHMPTGSGKTKTALEAIIDFIRAKLQLEGFVLWFAHTRELCDQAYSSLNELWKVRGDFPLPIYRLFGSGKLDEKILKENYGFIFIGFQKFHSLLHSNSSIAKQIRWHLGGKTKLVVVDEAHKTLAKTYKAAIDYVSSDTIDCRLIGLTATPGRSADVNDQENILLANYFGDNLISIKDPDTKNQLQDSIKYLQEKGYLANINLKTIESNLPITLTPDEIKKISLGQDVSDNKLEEISSNAVRNKIIIDEIKAGHDSNESIMVFASTKSHCLIIYTILKSLNIRSEVILGSTPEIYRDKFIKEFKDGDLKILINYGVLTTGFDAPKLNRLIIARPTASAVLYSQMIGRALRGPKNGGNAENTIIDMKDNFLNLGETNFIYSYWSDFWGKCPKCHSDNFVKNHCSNCSFSYD